MNYSFSQPYGLLQGCVVRGVSVLITPARPALLLLLLFRPWLESPPQLAGFLSLGQTPKPHRFTLLELHARGGDLPRGNPKLQGRSRNLRDLGDLRCRVELWTHKSNLALNIATCQRMPLAYL